MMLNEKYLNHGVTLFPRILSAFLQTGKSANLSKLIERTTEGQVPGACTAQKRLIKRTVTEFKDVRMAQTFGYKSR